MDSELEPGSTPAQEEREQYPRGPQTSEEWAYVQGYGDGLAEQIESHLARVQEAYEMFGYVLADHAQLVKGQA